MVVKDLLGKFFKILLVGACFSGVIQVAMDTVMAETHTIVCEKGKYSNTCLSDGRSVSVRQYVKEHSKYKKVVDTKTTGKYNHRKIEIVVGDK